jgi:hypothetical protein
MVWVRLRDALRYVLGVLVAFVIGVLVACSSAPRSFAPVEPIPLSQFSYQYLDEIQRAHVKDGVVNYPAIAQDDRFQFFIWQLDRFNPNELPSRQHSLAFWINAYNAFAIKGILNGYVPQSVWGRYRYFIPQHHYVGGRPISLHDLEEDLLVPDFRDPRLHFAIVPASRSAPKLSSQVYAPERLDQQLNDSARAFINDASRNRFDRQKKVAYLSMIFKWHEKEFIGHSGSLLRYVARYVDDPALARDLTTNRYDIQFLDYDWSLNGISDTRRH